MKVEFVEKYATLSSMVPGQAAVSKDRTKFFVCGRYYDKKIGKTVKVILDANNLSNQHTDGRDLNQPIKILKSGDVFVCTSH